MRRLFVLASVAALVFAVANMFHDPSSSGSAADQAVQVSAETTPKGSGGTDATADVPVKARWSPKQTKAAQLPLVDPEGDCRVDDIRAAPVIDEVAGGRPIPIRIELSTKTTPACYWKVSPRTVTVSITSGEDPIWSTRQCRSAVPTRDVVLRQAVPTPLTIMWSSRRSDEHCSDDRTAWALPGDYHVLAAALGGDPTDVQFTLTKTEDDPASSQQGESKGSSTKRDAKSGGDKQSGEKQGKQKQGKHQSAQSDGDQVD